MNRLKNVSIVCLFLVSIVSFVMPAHAANRPPQVGTVTPSSGSSQPNIAVTFTSTYTDPNGSSDIGSAYLLINSTLTAAKSFYAFYDRTANKIYLLDDSGQARLGGYAPGSSHTPDEAVGSASQAQSMYNLKDAPTYRITIDTSRTTNIYAGQVNGSTGYEITTADRIPVLGIEKLGE